MDIVAHGLWTAAAATVAKRSGAHIRIGWAAWWGMFPDVLAFGPMVAIGLWMRLKDGSHFPHPHIGLPLYPMGHSLVIFAAVFGLAALILRRVVWELAGWLLHILIDIPTHSYRYYATRFLWPLSSYRFDGIPWWTPWLLWCTYGALAVVYLLLWRKGWLGRRRPSPTATVI